MHRIKDSEGSDAIAVKIPERNLWARVMESALRDAFKGPRLLKSEAKNWIFSPNDKPYSFLWVCEVIEFCPRAIRRAVTKKELRF